MIPKYWTLSFFNIYFQRGGRRQRGRRHPPPAEDVVSISLSVCVHVCACACACVCVCVCVHVCVHAYMHVFQCTSKCVSSTFNSLCATDLYIDVTRSVVYATGL